ncbi:TIGR03905 family TSCPD domain-containing protein [Pseudodesulfovibrio sp.]|uniref:TIGR03905 family TSCPD domain-containing protein n=1 Tax=Pseudodesulfovibrio sp. TaxID=2035812 RepID=UPI0026092892|nr:TIGR03905 family TSCPD domain-containing protein [Pseudodesulfovibrio sp.]MDD3313495.1 TIGR03905 family TSCPD domain-containing protein [Pseudodesulfovibrio sp.]
MDNAQHHGASIGSAARPRMQHFVPEQGVCAKEIDFVVDNGSIDYVSFVGGCEGNHKAIASMVEGMNVQFVLDRFSGITCGSKSTSCVDQFCHALREYLERQPK